MKRLLPCLVILLLPAAAQGITCPNGYDTPVCADYCQADYFLGKCSIECYWNGLPFDRVVCGDPMTVEECAYYSQAVPQCPEPPPYEEPHLSDDSGSTTNDGCGVEM